jgi:hypothetical protein
VIPHEAVGCPIRRSEDQRALAPPLGFSQRATSFIASRCQGIHQMPFMCRARAQPRARDQWSVVRRQWSDTSRRPLPDRGRAWGLLRKHQPRPMLAHRPTHTHAQARPPRGDGRTCFTVTTRFTISKGRGQMSDDRCQMAKETLTSLGAFGHSASTSSVPNAIPMTR